MASGTEPLTIYLQDEIPRLGSGMRRVEVTRVGRKWVHLRRPGSDRGTKIRRATWDGILASKRNQGVAA